MKQKNDPAIEQVRKVRHSISAAHEHDAEKLVNYYIELQKGVSSNQKARKDKKRVSNRQRRTIQWT